MMCTRSLGKVIIHEHIMYSLGHSSSLQDLDSVEDPIQSAPPCSGGGLSQVQDHQMRLLPVIMVPVPLMVNGDHGQVEPVLLPVVMDSRQGVTYVTILPQPMVELLVKDQTESNKCY
jgi:hypothetical protein